MHAKGFTLIEILVVLIIIGITISFALLAFGDFGASRRVIITAEQFANYIKLLQHRAIIEMKPFGVSVNQDRYQTFRFEHDIWKPMSERSIFHTQTFPNNLVMKFQNPKNNRQSPDIIISASGDMTAFTLYFGTTQKPKLATLVGNHNGQIALVLPQVS
ncbi:type II secretion system minor pseudopilin GspH [Legionella clemsonensis]|uniref:Type II secretion system protein H n=1 Tax=Legionella clemsonensis TaxID=1867846 RepID=A0A222P1Q1_9GAMM|nr:type II secretion system minor pseudopilin GspH [Legionella clemsonensis]ASQ45782.1 Putative type II secretion system protein H precursor [Legionella clemsonensis]